MPGGSRGIVMLHWTNSLREAGFTADGRTDMEVFGHPDEQSPDSRATWIHVTDRQPTTPRRTPPRPAPTTVTVTVPLDPATTPMVQVGVFTLDLGRPTALRLTYHAGGRYAGVMDVVGEFTDAAWRLPGKQPAWIQELIDEHQPPGFRPGQPEPFSPVVN